MDQRFFGWKKRATKGVGEKIKGGFCFWCERNEFLRGKNEKVDP